jgi:hypothetical protein
MRYKVYMLGLCMCGCEDEDRARLLAVLLSKNSHDIIVCVYDDLQLIRDNALIAQYRNGAEVN